MKKRSPFIKEYKCDLKINKSLINKIGREKGWKRSLTIGGSTNSIRTSDSFFISSAGEGFKKFDDVILNAFGDAIKKYIDEFKIEAMMGIEDEGYHVLRYKKGCFYGLHTDHHPTKIRDISGILYLNSDFTGGETKFEDGTIVKPKKNTILLFPSNFVFPHESLKIKRGVKYCVVTWFRFK